MKSKKTHKYQIDLSIKIEDTSKASYVCLSNTTTAIVSISARDKRELKIFFRKLNRPLIFKLFTFSVLCAKSIAISGTPSVTIDTEYISHETEIHSFIIQILTIWKNPHPTITFNQVGRDSHAHIKALEASRKKQKVLPITINEVLILFNLIDKS